MENNKITYIILSEKSWNQDLVRNLSCKSNQINWVLISSKDDFNNDNLKKINPDKIFIPHWSYLIPDKIYNNFECIVFHMTDLPYGRGGSPLQNLIIRGHKHTKISAIRVVKELDAGPIYLKKDLILKGSAQEIFDLANEVVKDMIIEIVKTKPVPIKQEGKPTLFKRRKPSMSNMNDLESLDEVYDFIRMLDADGYPNAFLETEKLKFEFTDANFKNKNEIIATVKIKIE
jgi:methionyl-tRNA formyltransferase